MRVRFSIRELLVGVLVAAATISVLSFFNDWRRSYVEKEFRTFRTLEKLQSLSNGDDLSKVQLLFDDLMPLDRDLAKMVLSKPELSSTDEVFTVVINEASARFLHFSDGQLVDFTFTAKDMENSLQSLQTPVPQWYIQYGDWLIVGILLVVFSFLRMLVLAMHAKARHND